MSLLSLSEARGLVIAEVTKCLPRLRTEAVTLSAAIGRILAEDVRADRDQPPFPRSTRDGFAVRADDLAHGAAGGETVLRVIGEVAAGAVFSDSVPPGAAVEIMTGAPVPEGADAVVMVEQTERRGTQHVAVKRVVAAGENIVPRASEIAASAVAFPAGRALDVSAIALLASLGCARPVVFARPRVAILSTGDELVPVETVPSLAQIRDSNRHCLAALVDRAGGSPIVMPIVRDDRAAIEATLAEAAASADLILVTGGVSMGKYDHVEPALASLSARVIFDGVAIRPGKPLVFGFLSGKPFFGLPGNPLSALVTFELFAKPALELCAGRERAAPIACFGARLSEDLAERALPLTAFLPARFVRSASTTGLEPPRVTPVSSQGSGDLAAMAAADGFLILEPGVTSLSAGTWVSVLPR